MPTRSDVASMLDLHIIEPGILLAEIEQACQLAKKLKLSSVCIPALFAKKAAALLQNSGVALTVCIGFPYGFQATESKLAEMLLAMVDGVDELEVLINYTAIKNADWNYVANEISHLLPVVRNAGKKLNLVIEASQLSRGEMIKCCELYSTAEVDLIAASTGKTGPGPGYEDLRFLRSIISGTIKLKTFESNLTLAKLEALVKLGVDRVGVNFDDPVLNELND